MSSDGVVSAPTVSLGWLDLAVLLVLFVGVTWLADRLAGRAQGPRDFFLGGRRLPWPAVSASIIATEISAVTFVSLPSVVFRQGGDLTYLQIVLAYGVSRCLVAWVLVPRYLEREVYSPYEYLGSVLGARAGRTATGLFLFGGVLAQGARVYLTALILEVLLLPQFQWVEQWTGFPPLLSATVLIVGVALLWTLLGGIATVIWTDALMSALLVIGLVISIFVLGQRLDGEWGNVLQAAGEAGKLRLFDWSTSWFEPYTVWAAVFGATVGGVGAFGTDQLVAQRLFCCRSVRDARLAMVSSFAGIIVTLLVMLLGLGLWFYSSQASWAAPGSAPAAAIAAQADRVFPVFILYDLPAGLRALVIAGALGAAVSSLDSILTALAQGTQALLARTSELQSEKSNRLAHARRLVVLWAMVLGAVGLSMAPLAVRYRAILDLALAMAGLAGGALLAGVLMAIFQATRAADRRADLGARYAFAAPLSTLVLVGVVAHSPAAQAAIVLAGLFLVALRGRRGGGWALVVDTVVLLLGTGVAWAASRWGLSAQGAPLAWPWYVPLGATLAFTTSCLLRLRAAR